MAEVQDFALAETNYQTSILMPGVERFLNFWKFSALDKTQHPLRTHEFQFIFLTVIFLFIVNDIYGY